MWRILAAMPEKKALMIGVGGSVIVTTCKFCHVCHWFSSTFILFLDIFSHFNLFVKVKAKETYKIKTGCLILRGSLHISWHITNIFRNSITISLFFFTLTRYTILYRTILVLNFFLSLFVFPSLNGCNTISRRIQRIQWIHVNQSRSTVYNWSEMGRRNERMDEISKDEQH